MSTDPLVMSGVFCVCQGRKALQGRLKPGLVRQMRSSSSAWDPLGSFFGVGKPGTGELCFTQGVSLGIPGLPKIRDIFGGPHNHSGL